MLNLISEQRPPRRVLVTGSQGFIGKNLVVHLQECIGFQILECTRETSLSTLSSLIQQADAIIHLAGENRPKVEQNFYSGNVGFSKFIVEQMQLYNKKIPLVYTSSTQAALGNPYGRSKLEAERIISKFAVTLNSPVSIFRLPGVFGKWCKPDYNSVVATFCYNIARNLPIIVSDPDQILSLVYVDDVVSALIAALDEQITTVQMKEVMPSYQVTLGELAQQIQTFHKGRQLLQIDRVGSGFNRALYATYISYLPQESFVYTVPQYVDQRGAFVEMLKTPETGQFSYFTAHPGITRGGHYHHTKTEKFLVIKGKACFRFRHLISNESLEVIVDESLSQIVDTIPGWVHDVTNIGDSELVVMLWANEVFDRQRPDTINSKVGDE